MSNVMLSGAQRSRSISIGELTSNASNEAVEMLRLRSAPLSMTALIPYLIRVLAAANVGIVAAASGALVAALAGAE